MHEIKNEKKQELAKIVLTVVSLTKVDLQTFNKVF